MATKRKSAGTADTFDKLMHQLQGVVEQLEKPDLPLEKSLEAFEQGIKLARRGQDILDAAERKVEVLLQDGSKTSLESADNA